MNKDFAPSLFDKLFDVQPVKAARRCFSLDKFKDTVARDLEALLNTRTVLDADRMVNFPLAGRSVACFGLDDFAGLSLANVYDRQRICQSIESAIAAHEPRLREIRVSLDLHRNSINALYFSIKAVLVVYPAQEPVCFDAMLQPSSLQYAVMHRRLGAEG